MRTQTTNRSRETGALAKPGRPAVDLLRLLQALERVVCDPQVTDAEVRVFACLLLKLNRRSGRCDPGLDRVARETGRSVRRAGAAVAKLTDRGLLHRRRNAGTCKTNAYHFDWDKLAEPVPEQAGSEAEAGVAGRSEAVAPEPVLENGSAQETGRGAVLPQPVKPARAVVPRSDGRCRAEQRAALAKLEQMRRAPMAPIVLSAEALRRSERLFA